MKKRIAAGAMGAALLAGGGVGAALMAPTIATAADESTADESTADESTPSGSEGAGERGQWVTEALSKLVEDDTITQAQADAVEQALEAARPEGGPHGPGGRGRGPGLGAAATALGIEADALRTALQDGQTIADVARANGVDVTTVIDAIVAEMNSHLDEAVTSGRLTQAQADELKANAAARATDLVNGELAARGPGGFGGPPPGGPGSGTDGSGTGSSGTGSSDTATSTSV